MPEAFGMTYQIAPSNSYVKLLKRKGCTFSSTLMKDALAAAFEDLGVPASDIVIEVEEVRWSSVIKL